MKPNKPDTPEFRAPDQGKVALTLTDAQIIAMQMAPESLVVDPFKLVTSIDCAPESSMDKGGGERARNAVALIEQVLAKGLDTVDGSEVVEIVRKHIAETNSPAETFTDLACIVDLVYIVLPIVVNEMLCSKHAALMVPLLSKLNLDQSNNEAARDGEKPLPTMPSTVS